MTMTEKILARHSGNGQVRPGDNIWTEVDKLLTHDVCGPGTFGIFQREFGMDAEVVAPARSHGAETEPNRSQICLEQAWQQFEHWNGCGRGQFTAGGCSRRASGAAAAP